MTKPAECPACGGTKVLPIIYGYPTEETDRRARRGKVVLGGCVVREGQPDWSCAACEHRWAERPGG